MSASHDSEIQINLHEPASFCLFIKTNYDLSEISITKINNNAFDGSIIINYNLDKYQSLIENIRHAAIAWNYVVELFRNGILP